MAKRKRARPIKYKEVISFPRYRKALDKATKYELCVTIRIKNIYPKPSCYERKDQLIMRLRKNMVYKALDLDGITDAKKFREALNDKKYF